MAMGRPCAIGFIGTRAAHSYMFLDTLRLIPETVGEIALVEADAERARRAGVESVYPDLEAMLAAGRPDVCFVMVPTDEVEGPAVRCAQAGIPLVIDKHVANGSAVIRRILAACERGGSRMTTCYTWRYSPAVGDVRRWLAEGVVGRPYCFDLRMVTTSAAVRMADPQFAWLFQRARSGGGILLWLGCHFIDLVRHVFQREVVAVIAATARLTDAPSDVEDVASVSLELEGGVVGTLHAAYVMPEGFASPYDTGVAIWGDKGDIVWEPFFRPHPTLRVRTRHPAWADEPERQVAYRDAIVPQAYCERQFVVDYFRDMIQCLVRGEEFVVSGQDALRVVEVCEAAYRSAESGRRVELAGRPGLRS